MGELESLLVRVAPLTPAHTVNDVGDMLLRQDYRRFLCLPVVVEGRPIGSVSRDGLQGIFMSRYGRELKGRKSVVQIMNPRPLTVDLQQSADEVGQYITANIQFPITEDFIITRDGEYLGLGHVVDLIRTIQDRLDQRNQQLARAYQQLKSSQEQLVQSEKMASLGQLVAGVAHEINTPLGYVKNNVGLIRELITSLRSQLATYDDLLNHLLAGDADEAEVTRSLESLAEMRAYLQDGCSSEDLDGLFDDTLHGIDHIAEIVLNLRDFSRLDQAPVDEVSLNQCLDSALLIARNLLKHKAEVIKDYGDIPRVTCSPSQINQVFLNLLTNAAHAIESHGRIIIKTYADAQYVHATVQDSGCGIAEENLRKIFDPFFTTKPVGQGAGLGLSIAYRIVRNHGGYLRVASKVGVGTKFAVSLPIRPVRG